MRVASSINVPCYPIILDDDDPRDDQWQALLRNTDGARGVVFLSNWMFKNCPTKLPLLHLDGGSPKWHGDEAEEKTEKNLIVYAGGLDKWRGLDFLIAVVKNLKKSEYRFVICGKCDKDEILKKFDHDPRVDVRGFVSDEELHEICLRAALFLNTRDPSLEKNMVVNFPSKILNYLAYGKPVVSTALTSFSDDYQRFLQIVKEDNPIMFGKKVQEVLEWDTSVRRRHYDELKEWFCANKLWRDQAKRLLDWIK
jgi:glycosyltransferase involved in cell wall biosynthesis